MRIGIDLGGTKIEGVVLDGRGVVHARERVPTPADDYEGICEAVAAIVRRLEAEAGEPCTVGLSMPGSVSPSTGLMRNANSVCLNDRSLPADLQRLLGRPVRAENDANCMLVSEASDGAAAGYPSAFGVIAGTGIGGAVWANGTLLQGANAIGGEWGHNPVPWAVAPGERRACWCGRSDCVETWLSGPGLVRTWRSMDGDAPNAGEGAEALVAAARDGRPSARAALGRHAAQFAAALAVVLNVLDPAVVVVAGGLSNLPGLCEAVAAELPAHVFADRLETPIVVAAHGDSSGVRGAAWLWGPHGARAG